MTPTAQVDHRERQARAAGEEARASTPPTPLRRRNLPGSDDPPRNTRCRETIRGGVGSSGADEGREHGRGA